MKYYSLFAAGFETSDLENPLNVHAHAITLYIRTVLKVLCPATFTKLYYYSICSFVDTIEVLKKIVKGIIDTHSVL
jgi:hypothetical protein